MWWEFFLSYCQSWLKNWSIALLTRLAKPTVLLIPTQQLPGSGLANKSISKEFPDSNLIRINRWLLVCLFLTYTDHSHTPLLPLVDGIHMCGLIVTGAVTHMRTHAHTRTHTYTQVVVESKAIPHLVPLLAHSESRVVVSQFILPCWLIPYYQQSLILPIY